MASVSSAHLVLFIAAILFSAALAGTLTESANSLGASIEDAADADATRTATAFQIVSDDDAPSAVYDADTETLTVLVKNTGDTTIPSQPDDVTLLVDGAYQTDTQTTALDDDRWRPGTVLRVRTNVTLAPDTETRVVVDASGHRDYFVFTTPA
ncbi:archaellum stator protein ArlG [Halobacterium rubrum]|uniref:flagellin n=1 Tax=Halobacterium TaxID=2239 RepID=UPI001F182DB2|nr:MULTISPECIES: flagellin [Halobacterium]MDH5020470.1 flagellin [Halobacterium rubrum]